jgi:nicotinate-nucleotide--dimethylbenzimidazole phosphoribosyltransferase
MSETDAMAALDVGADVAAQLVTEGARCLVTGEMGIGNTTPSAAVVAVLSGQSPRTVTGRGTGIDDRMLTRKIGVIERALGRLSSTDPLSVLAGVGGLEIGALAGFIVGGAAAKVPVLLDGIIADAAALLACALVPDVVGYLVAGHRSSEVGATAALSHLGLKPLLDLDMRLGEGSGACLAVGIVSAAAHILREMATFDSAGVTDKADS